MSKRVAQVILLFLLPLAAGCFSVPYEQNRPPVPLITHQGELDVSGGIHFPYASGFDYQAVYSPLNHISTYAAFQFDRNNGYQYGGAGSPNIPDYFNRFFEIGLGYFDSIPGAHYEAYLLAGFGSGNDRQTDWSTSAYQTDTTTLNIFRIGVQQNIGIITETGASIGAGLGLGYEHLYNLNRNYTNYDKHEIEYYDSAIAISSFNETSPQSTLYAEPLIFGSFEFPLLFLGNDFCKMRFTGELWLTYRTNPYPAFGGGNASFTVSLDF